MIKLALHPKEKKPTSAAIICTINICFNKIFCRTEPICVFRRILQSQKHRNIPQSMNIFVSEPFSALTLTRSQSRRNILLPAPAPRNAAVESQHRSQSQRLGPEFGRDLPLKPVSGSNL